MPASYLEVDTVKGENTQLREVPVEGVPCPNPLELKEMSQERTAKRGSKLIQCLWSFVLTFLFEQHLITLPLDFSWVRHHVASSGKQCPQGLPQQFDGQGPVSQWHCGSGVIDVLSYHMRFSPQSIGDLGGLSQGAPGERLLFQSPWSWSNVTCHCPTPST